MLSVATIASVRNASSYEKRCIQSSNQSLLSFPFNEFSEAGYMFLPVKLAKNRVSIKETQYVVLVAGLNPNISVYRLPSIQNLVILGGQNDFLQNRAP